MSKIKKTVAYLLLFFIILSVASLSACKGSPEDSEGGGASEDSEIFEDKSDIFIVSEETFNTQIKSKSKTNFKFSPEKIYEKREKHILGEKKYYALFYVKDAVIKEADIMISIQYEGTLDDEIYVGTSKGKVTGERRGLTSCTVTREGKTVKANLFLAVGFTVDKISDASNSSQLPIYFWGYSKYDYSEDARNNVDTRIEKKINVFHEKQISAASSIKYLTENDFKSGSYGDKLADTAENVAIGDKIYAVIDYKLSGGRLIEEMDILTMSLTAKGSDGAKFTLSVEEFPTADYSQTGASVTASFKIYGAVSEEKLFRFIVSILPESAGNISINTEIYGEKISVTEGESASEKLEITGDTVSESKLEYTLSADGKYYIVTGLGGENREEIKIPLTYNALPVKEIADNVFSNVSYIKKVELTDVIKKIGANAFRGCVGLESIIIPSYVTVIGDNAFADCPDTGIYCKAERRPDTWSETWAPADAYVLWGYSWMMFKSNDSGYSFTQNGMGENVAIPREYNGKPVTEISSVGYPQKTLKKVIIPDTVKLIGQKAFEGCTALKEIVIPDSVEGIGQSAFYGCTALRTVILGENSSLRYISKWAFYECTALTSFTVTKNVTSISENAFLSCEKLVEVINKSSLTFTLGADTNGCITKYALKVHSGSSEIANKNGYQFYTHNGKNYLLGYVGDQTALSLPVSYNGTSYEIYKYAFYENPEIIGIDIPNGVTRIGKYAFYICPSLTDVTVSSDVEAIEEYAFYSCKVLKTLDLPESGKLKNIGGYAFYGCVKLADIALPDSITHIESAAFTDTSHYNNTSNWVNGFLYIGKHLIKAEASKVIHFIDIKEGTLSVAAGAMSGCNLVVRVKVPESVKHIGSSAFSNCNKLVEVINKSTLDITKDSYGLKAFVVHPESSKIAFINDYMFFTSDGVSYLIGYTGADTELTLPEDFNGEGYEIYKYAFYERADLTKVIIPNNVTVIGEKAFYNCEGIIEITIPDSVTAIGDRAFYSCDNLKKVTVGIGVKSIENAAFMGCSTLQGVYISDISKWCEIEFGNCYSNPIFFAKNLYLNGVLVTELKIPSGVTHISSNAFYNCTSIQYVYIPTSVTNIGEYAFYGHTDTLNFVYQGTETQWNGITKESYWFNGRIRVTYNHTDSW